MKHILLTTIAALLLVGCGESQQPSPVEPTEPVAKKPTQQSPPSQSSLATTYPRPAFEPMSLEQYKAAHPNLPGLACGIEKFFDTYINVFGVTIAAMPKTPVPEIIHAAKVYAHLIDNDEDFIPDDRKFLIIIRKIPRDGITSSSWSIPRHWITHGSPSSPASPSGFRHRRFARGTPASGTRGTAKWTSRSKNCSTSTAKRSRVFTRRILVYQTRKPVIRGRQPCPMQWIEHAVSTGR